MLIPLGILASSGGGAGGSFELISSTILGSTTASVTFDVSTLASTYKHLQIREVMRGTAAANGVATKINFNGDTASNYSYHYLQGYNSSATSGGTSSSNAWGSEGGAANLASGVFGAGVTDILDPFSTSKNKTTRTLTGAGTVNGGAVVLYSGNWRSTSAVTSIVLTPSTGSYAVGSRFSIYGIKGV